MVLVNLTQRQEEKKIQLRNYLHFSSCGHVHGLFSWSLRNSIKTTVGSTTPRQWFSVTQEGKLRKPGRTSQWVTFFHFSCLCSCLTPYPDFSSVKGFTGMPIKPTIFSLTKAFCPGVDHSRRIQTGTTNSRRQSHAHGLLRDIWLNS